MKMPFAEDAEVAEERREKQSGARLTFALWIFERYRRALRLTAHTGSRLSSSAKGRRLKAE